MAGQYKTLKARLKRPIVMIGMMGAGKTRIGRALSHALTLPFYDSDAIIEEKAGCSIAEIFERDGELKFREVESSTIIELIDQGPGIISTGGGAMMNARTQEHVLERGLAVWVYCDLDVTLERLQGDTSRPLLQAPDPKSVLEKLMTEREEIYKKAPLVCNTTHQPAEHAVANLIDEISEFLD